MRFGNNQKSLGYPFPSAVGQGKEKSYMIRKVTILGIIFLILFTVPLMAGNFEKEKAAILSAEKWLAFVDAQKYPESWKEAAEFFRNAVS